MASPKEKPVPATSRADELAHRYGDGADERETVVSIFGQTSRSGPWAPAEETRAVAGFADVVLDFTEADLPAGVTEVRAWAVFGTVEIRIPASLEVELSGLALLGNVVHRAGQPSRTRRKLRRWLRLPEPPPRPTDRTADAEAVLCVNGTALVGNIVVKVL